MHCFSVLGFFEIIDLVWTPKSSVKKQSERKRLKTSSIIYSARKLGSRTFDKSDLTWNGSVSASLISPSSFGLFGMQVQHQTSTHAGNILSRYGNPCKLDPVQVYATCMCLPKRKGKWALPKKKSCQGIGRLFGKGRMFGTPFFKTNPEELSTLCIYPENSWTKQRMCRSKKDCLSQNLPTFFILQLRRNIPLTTMTSIVCCFGNHAMERNASTLTQPLRWDDIEVKIEWHLLEQLLKPTRRNISWTTVILVSSEIMDWTYAHDK